MKIKVTRTTSVDLPNTLAGYTIDGNCKAPDSYWISHNHSPVRGIEYLVQMDGIYTKTSVHFVRHKIGVEHFVKTNRTDRGGDGDESINRLTPVNHAMLVNAESLINMAYRRLCYMAEKPTVAVMSRIRSKCPEELQAEMVPACARLGYCPEAKECDVGLLPVLKAYKDTVPMRKRAAVYGELKCGVKLKVECPNVFGE
jgi:hypothetical protein